MAKLVKITYERDPKYSSPRGGNKFFHRGLLFGRRAEEYAERYRLPEGFETLQINHRSVSGLHGAIILDSGRYLIVDFESRNGTILRRDGTVIQVHSFNQFHAQEKGSEVHTILRHLTSEDNPSLVSGRYRSLKSGDQIELARGAFTAEFYEDNAILRNGYPPQLTRE